jgi:hypothetical protein
MRPNNEGARHPAMLKRRPELPLLKSNQAHPV